MNAVPFTKLLEYLPDANAGIALFEVSKRLVDCRDIVLFVIKCPQSIAQNVVFRGVPPGRHKGAHGLLNARG